MLAMPVVALYGCAFVEVFGKMTGTVISAPC